MSQKSTPIRHFLLVFDHSADQLIDVQEFGTDSERAVEAYATRERDLEKGSRIEVVLIGSDSLETIMQTHANYFDGPAAVSSKYLDLALAGS